MPHPAQMPLDAVAERLGFDATVTPFDGSAPFTVKTWPEGETEFTGGVQASQQRRAMTLMVRASEWPTPRAGDVLAVLGETRRVEGRPSNPDALRLVWRLDTEAV